jgi:hypothetical protein
MQAVRPTTMIKQGGFVQERLAARLSRLAPGAAVPPADQPQAPPLEIRVVYGFGATCIGRLRKDQLPGLSVRQALQIAAGQAQADAPATHVAMVIHEALSSRRALEAELYRAGDDLERPGAPLSLDAPLPVSTNGDATPGGDVLAVLVSESYRGGADQER